MEIDNAKYMYYPSSKFGGLMSENWPISLDSANSRLPLCVCGGGGGGGVFYYCDSIKIFSMSNGDFFVQENGWHRSSVYASPHLDAFTRWYSTNKAGRSPRDALKYFHWIESSHFIPVL